MLRQWELEERPRVVEDSNVRSEIRKIKLDNRMTFLRLRNGHINEYAGYGMPHLYMQDISSSAV